MTPFDELWSGRALADLEAFPASTRDQVEALVRELCRDPLDGATTQVPGSGQRVLEAGLLAVFYQVDELDRLVYVLRAVWRG